MQTPEKAPLLSQKLHEPPSLGSLFPTCLVTMHPTSMNRTSTQCLTLGDRLSTIIWRGPNHSQGKKPPEYIRPPSVLECDVWTSDPLFEICSGVGLSGSLATLAFHSVTNPVGSTPHTGANPVREEAKSGFKTALHFLPKMWPQFNIVR